MCGLSIKVFILLVVRLTFGFLLDGPSNTTQNVLKSQYVTRNEFLNKNRVLHQDTADLRHDMDQTFEMLTTQLKQRLDAFEKQVKSLEQINATELDDLKTEYEALSKKYATLQNHTDAIQKENAALKQELSILKNTTDQFATELSELKSLKGIQTLQEVAQIKQDLKTSSDKIHELQTREQARSQDFVALYNMSLNTNAELKSVKEHIESNVSLLSGRIEVNAEQVALLAYATVTKATGPIKFNNVGFSVGIRNLTSFETDGKFTCEIPGLYLVSVSISTYETYSNLIMYKNGVAIASSEISHGSSRRYASGTATVVTALMADDTVWVECNYEILLGHYPHLSIVKLK